jgi:hypothetical protein
LERTVVGEFEAARWTPHGLLIGLQEGAFLFDPEDGGRRQLPPGTIVSSSNMAAADRLVAMRAGAIELWQVGGDRALAAWEIPAGRTLELADISADGRLYVLRDILFAQTYVLRLDAGREAGEAPGGADSLVEMWRTEQAHVDVGPARLHPTEPLLALVADGDISLVDLARGSVIWQSTGTVATADQSFRSVRWITGGEYLVTQAQLPQASSIFLNIGVWRWDEAQRQLILLQQAPSSGLLGIDPQARVVLAGEPGQEQAADPLVYPLLLDARRLQQEVQESCLLQRLLDDQQRQAFSIVGR